MADVAPAAQTRPSQVVARMRSYRGHPHRGQPCCPPFSRGCPHSKLPALHSLRPPPPPKVMAKLQGEQGIKGKIAAFLLAASAAYIKAQRIASGRSLQFALEPPMAIESMGAAVLAVLLRPLQLLAQLLVFSKVGARHGGVCSWPAVTAASTALCVCVRVHVPVCVRVC